MLTNKFTGEIKQHAALERSFVALKTLAFAVAASLVFSTSGASAQMRNASFQTGENAPKRIVFVNGKTSSTQTGTLRRTKTIDDVHYYVVRAKAGQTLTVRVTASSGAAALGVNNADGEQISEGIDDRFSQKLAASGDYRVSVFNPGNGNLGNTRYTLTVSIK